MATADVRVFRSGDPDVSSDWGGTVADVGEPHLAHAAEWLTAIPEAYGHEPLYLMAEDGDGHRGVLPAFIVRRPVAGTVVSSMPFLDGGGPCSSTPAIADALVGRLVEEARRAGADVVELRGPQRLGVDVAPTEHKVNLTLPLPADAESLWRQFDGSVRNQIRKAERSGLSVEFGGGEKLDDFYAIFANRMRELGSPVHARRFFGAIFAAFGGRARVALVMKGTMPIGGLIALTFRNVLAVPWASCLSQYLPSCPNMLLYWETIRSAFAQGLQTFDFGRSSRNSGTYRFKRQWGAQEEPLFWYSIPMGRRAARPSSGDGRRTAFLAGSWRHLPLAVTRHLGPHIRRYLTQ
jgi:FemAB-related protein (PEP-CTERM system-associated)